MSAWHTALAQLFLEHRARLERLVRRRTGDGDRAADLVQESFLRLLAAGGTGSASGDTRLLYAVTRNAAIDQQRSARRRAAAMQALAPEQLRSEDAAADAGFDARAALTALEAALRELPERTREVFLLRRVDGLPHAEIAARLGMPVSTVEKHLLRAIRHCQARLADHLDPS